MKNLLCLILLPCLVSISLAQDYFPPAFKITSDTTPYTRFPAENWQILEDIDGKLDYDGVSRVPLANGFHTYDPTHSERDPAVHAYWFRYTLVNAMDRNAHICLGDTLPPMFRFFSPLHEYSDYYVTHGDEQVTHLINGLLVPWSKLDGFKENRLLPIALSPGEKCIVYRRVYNSYKIFPASAYDLRPGFASTESVIHQSYDLLESHFFKGIQNAFLFGVLVFAGVFFFFFFVIARERVHLYFSLYLFSLGVGRVNIYAEMYEVSFREHPWMYVYGSKFLWVFSIIFLIHFIRHLLNTKELLPGWNRFLIIISSLFVVTYLLSILLDFAFAYNLLLHNAINYELLLLDLSIPVTVFLCAKWFTASRTLTFIVLPALSIWALCFILFNIRATFGGPLAVWLTQNWHTTETLLLSCLVVSFSWILLHRFSDLRRQMAQKELEREIEKTRLMETQKIELEEQVVKRTAELAKSLENLKSTQYQLIQSEKMASLGELTAGIAHEIQNPLNFVNNFSEVNKELLTEMNAEIENGNFIEVRAIAKSIAGNEEKIITHGKRADSIVKGMLQHSRSSTGVRELTDINVLIEEYFRLAYHGLRARDKTFNAIMKTEFDSSLEPVNIVPQDIGRVVLNLITNAFYAVAERAKAKAEGYEPTVTVSTHNVHPLSEGTPPGVLIIVRDNGNGIPDSIKGKIFQPFFTTKPAGQGTGLGLSLSYDIVKAHHGILSVESTSDGGSEFSMRLPIA